MYAIIVTGGKQYRVEQGDIVYIEKLDGRGNYYETPTPTSSGAWKPLSHDRETIVVRGGRDAAHSGAGASGRQRGGVAGDDRRACGRCHGTCG